MVTVITPPAALPAGLDGGTCAPTDAQALATLANADAPMLEVMQALATLDDSAGPWRTGSVGIAANITVDLLPAYLRRHAYLAGVRLKVFKGHYDDLLGDVQAHRQAGVDLLLVLPFFDNLQPSWELSLATLEGANRQAPMQDWLARLDLALRSAEGIPQVLVLGPHLWQPDVPQDSAPCCALQEFSAGLRAVAARHGHTRVLDTAGLLASLGAWSLRRSLARAM